MSLLQRTPSSSVNCHATGFYPHGAMMFWRRNGEEIHEGVNHGEILPNHDGTFQMSVDLDLSTVTPEEFRNYNCVFLLSGVNKVIITKLEKGMIRTNWSKTRIMCDRCEKYTCMYICSNCIKLQIRLVSPLFSTYRLSVSCIQLTT